MFRLIIISSLFIFLTTNTAFAQHPNFKNALSLKADFFNYKLPITNDFGDVSGSHLDNGLSLTYVRQLNQSFNLAVPLRYGAIRYPINDIEFAEDKKSVFSTDATVHFYLKKKNTNPVISSYLLTGVGISMEQDSGAHAQFPIGIGLNIKIVPNLYLNLQTEYRFATADRRNNLVHGLGLKFLLDVKEDTVEDRDKDGVSDALDQCPDTPGVAAFNGCPDTDNDGLADKDDDCPTVPGLRPFNGCPDTDRDGIQDSKDDCPTEAGPASNNGCPLNDKDQDGILDENDRCPDVPGTIAMNGCPDTDQDGLADPDDRCPTQAGPISNNGCPEITKEDKEQLEFVTQAIEFETGKATLKSISYPLLDQVAGILQKYPGYSVNIDGHTDSVGGAETNQLLSERRAQACALYLQRKGIDASRLNHRGFGESQPIADNRFKDGRQKNRRVEFNIFIE